MVKASNSQTSGVLGLLRMLLLIRAAFRFRAHCTALRIELYRHHCMNQGLKQVQLEQRYRVLTVNQIHYHRFQRTNPIHFMVFGLYCYLRTRRNFFTISKIFKIVLHTLTFILNSQILTTHQSRRHFKVGQSTFRIFQFQQISNLTQFPSYQSRVSTIPIYQMQVLKTYRHLRSQAATLATELFIDLPIDHYPLVSSINARMVALPTLGATHRQGLFNLINLCCGCHFYCTLLLDLRQSTDFPIMVRESCQIAMAAWVWVQYYLKFLCVRPTTSLGQYQQFHQTQFEIILNHHQTISIRQFGKKDLTRLTWCPNPQYADTMRFIQSRTRISSRNHELEVV